MRKGINEKDMKKRIVMTALCLLVVSFSGITGCSSETTEETNKSSTEDAEKELEKSKKEESEEEQVEEKVETKKAEGFDESRVGFYTNGSWGMDIKSIDNEAKTITYDGYESIEGYGKGAEEASCTNQTGKIIDDNTLDIYGVIIKWEGDTFEIKNEEDVLILSSMVGGVDSHDVGTGIGTYSKVDSVSQSSQEQSGSILRAVELYGGEYSDSRIYGDNPECPTNPCRVVVYNVTTVSFDFRIEQYNPQTRQYETIFNDHTAEFVGDGTSAAYYGEQYTLNFTFPDVTAIKVYGFEPVEGIYFSNNSIPGHEFS